MINNFNSVLVSVVMCVYNTPKEYLFDAVKSILNQTHNNLELIIVDDYSTADLYTDDIFKDKRITILKNDKNYGPSYSRNRALDIAKGKYIAIMDSDDISLPNRLEKQIEFMESNPDVVVAGSWFKYFGIKNRDIKRNVDDNEYYKCCLLFGNSPTVLNPSVMIRKEILDNNYIRYDEELRYGEDYKMWYQLSKLGRITNIKEVLVHYRTHEKQATHNYLQERKNDSTCNKVQSEMINELRLDLDEYEKDLFFNFIHAKKYNVNKYIEVLNKILEANKVTNIYKQDKLEQRVHEQWISAVQNVKNPFKIVPLIIKQKGKRKEILSIKLKQLRG